MLRKQTVSYEKSPVLHENISTKFKKKKKKTYQSAMQGKNPGWKWEHENSLKYSKNWQIKLYGVSAKNQ